MNDYVVLNFRTT